MKGRSEVVRAEQSFLLRGRGASQRKWRSMPCVLSLGRAQLHERVRCFVYKYKQGAAGRNRQISSDRCRRSGPALQRTCVEPQLVERYPQTGTPARRVSALFRHSRCRNLTADLLAAGQCLRCALDVVFCVDELWCVAEAFIIDDAVCATRWSLANTREGREITLHRISACHPHSRRD